MGLLLIPTLILHNPNILCNFARKYGNMDIPHLYSIQEISVTYSTGDAPVLVLCSDTQQYICKYMRPNATIAYKLACEFIGTTFAELWQIDTPPFAIITIQPAHWATTNVQHSLSPTIGFRKIDGVMDITPTTFRQTAANKRTLYQLLKIALFDFWCANEDRTYNNANMLYDIENDKFISIDYGGIINNVTFDFPLSQLTETDSILCADVFTHIVKAVPQKQLAILVQRLETDYYMCIKRCQRYKYTAIPLPREWNVPASKMVTKIEELLSEQWINATWRNFVECLKSNSNYGQ